MQLLDQIRLTSLIALARQHFAPDLTAPEIQILHDSASSEDPVEPPPNDNPDTRPHIRATFLRWLVTDPDALKLLDAKGFRIVGVTIDGPLDLDECRSPVTLYLSHCTLSETIDLRDAEFHAFCLRTSRLRADIESDRAVFHGPMLLINSEMTGDINLRGIQVKGDLDFRGTHLSNADKTLRIESASIDGSVFFNQKFSAATGIELNASHLGGSLICTNATIRSLVAVNTHIDGDLTFTDIGPPHTAELRLLNVECQTFTDDLPSWPSPGNLSLDGFRYQGLTLNPPTQPETSAAAPPHSHPLRENPPDSVDTRLLWLRRQNPQDLTRPGPWLQLADFYRRQGKDADARTLLFELAKLQARQTASPLLRWLLYPLRLAVAQLERDPASVLISVVLLLIIGSLVFGYAGATHSIAPTEKEAYSAWTRGAPLPPTYPSFNPIIYTLEIELPLVKLGQDDKWAPIPDRLSTPPLQPSKLNSATPQYTNTPPTSRVPYAALASLRWFLILIGWLQAAALGAAVGRRFKS